MATYTATVVKKATTGKKGEATKGLAYLDLSAALTTSDTVVISHRDLIGDGKPTILGGKFWGVEVDTNATPTGTFKIGTATDDDGLLTTKGAAVGLQNSLGGQLSYFFDGALLGTEWTPENIILTPAANSATGATSGRIWFEIEILTV